MKLKDVKGLLGEKKNDNDKDNGVVFKFGYNQAHDEIGEKDLNDYIELDEEKIKGIFIRCFENELGNGERKILIDKYDMEDLSEEIAKADIIKAKEEK